MQRKVSAGLIEIIYYSKHLSALAKSKRLFHELSLRLLKEYKWVLSQSIQRERNSSIREEYPLHSHTLKQWTRQINITFLTSLS